MFKAFKSNTNYTNWTNSFNLTQMSSRARSRDLSTSVEMTEGAVEMTEGVKNDYKKQKNKIICLH